RSHPLATVRGAFNAVFIEAEAAGSLMFYGQGAGGEPTASAVLGDVVSVARRKVLGGRGQYERPFHEDSRILPISAITTRYHITLDVVDRPGVLAAVSEVFSDEGASIELMRQTVGEVDDQGTQHAKLVLATHSNTDAILRRTVDRLGGLSVVRAVKSVIRVEGQ
ncbi:MAG: ACT domain-containing protein, partial [Brevibacterium aurantiacum]|nr:ACT domain-containing protein [Brevibacterium aurantiacum]